MVQRYYINNLARVSLIALLFSTIILRTIAEQQPVPMNKEDNFTSYSSETTPEESRVLDRLQWLGEKDTLNADEPQFSLSTATLIEPPMNDESAKLKGIAIPTAWDDEESPAPQHEEYPNDPTFEGQGLHGKGSVTM